jgi:hypothetical protein
VLRRQRAPYVRLSGRAASAAVAIAHRWPPIALGR